MEDSGLWEPWVHENIQDDLADTKRRLG
jgi:hypothetical protein